MTFSGSHEYSASVRALRSIQVKTKIDHIKFFFAATVTKFMDVDMKICNWCAKQNFN